jgi:hypothetical protein
MRSLKRSFFLEHIDGSVRNVLLTSRKLVINQIALTCKEERFFLIYCLIGYITERLCFLLIIGKSSIISSSWQFENRFLSI